MLFRSVHDLFYVVLDHVEEVVDHALECWDAGEKDFTLQKYASWPGKWVAKPAKRWPCDSASSYMP